MIAEELLPAARTASNSHPVNGWRHCARRRNHRLLLVQAKRRHGWRVGPMLLIVGWRQCAETGRAPWRSATGESDPTSAVERLIQRCRQKTLKEAWRV